MLITAMILAALTPFTVLSAALPATAAETCENVVAIWARGSGQDLGAAEFSRFQDQLKMRIDEDEVNLHIYELGSSSVKGHSYPAVPVGTGSLGAISNTVDAAVSGGAWFVYGRSVDEGADELDHYVEQQLNACPNSLFILGGYSQGAQVIGEAFVEKLTPAERGRVVFNILAGDPKLYLPEGESFLWYEAPACRGEGHSPWRREVPSCDTDNGSLGARKPYLPTSWQSSSGLWCADADFVCGSSKNPLTQSGHFTYANPGAAIDQGVLEAVERLAAMLPEKSPSLNTLVLNLKGGVAGLDVLFVIDSTGSMMDSIDDAKNIAGRLSSFVAAVQGRVALVEYRDAGDEFTARVLSGLSEDTDEFLAALDGITVDGGGDSPEALLHALKVGMTGVAWRSGATKAAIVLTDETFHNPDKVDGTTVAEIAALSLSIDPVNVYPVVPSYYAAVYAELAEATTGQVVINDSGSADALTEALTRIEARPVPLLALNRYFAASGEPIFFDGSASYSPTSTIVRWDWDFDGDGEFEVTDGESTATHAYPEPFTGHVQLRVTDENGLVANVSAPVFIDYTEDPPPVPAESLSVVGDGTRATLEWTGPEDPEDSWAILINGFPMASVDPTARTIEVTGLDRTDPIEFGVAPVSAEGDLGERRLATLEPEAPPTTTEPPPPTTTEPPAVTTEPSPAAPTVTLSATRVRPGDSLTVTGAGFKADGSVEVSIHSDPITVARTGTDGDGSFQVTVVIPRVPAGSHHLVVSDGTSTVRVPIVVLAGQELSATGPFPVVPVAASGVLLLLIGWGLIRLSTTRRTRQQTPPTGA